MKSKPLIIGFTGKARSGKDTAANFMCDLLHSFGIETYAYRLAGPLKGMIDVITGHKINWETADKEANLPVLNISPRKLAQTLGTEWGRSLDEYFWINIMKHSIEVEQEFRREYDESPIEIVLIPDVRFDNEAEMCDMLFEIRRPGTAAVRCHSSEGGVHESYITQTITNAEGLGELRQQVFDIALRIEEKFNADSAT